MYLGKPEYEERKTEVTSENAEEAIRLYIFAEQYNTLALRCQLVNDIWAHLHIRNYTFDEERFKVLQIAFNNLHDTSGLYRLLADDEIYNGTIADENEAEDWVAWVPVSVAARKLRYHYDSNGPVQSHAYRMLNVCDYHEHESEEDRVLCQ